MPPEIRTRATLRSAEFGFLGVVVYTRVQTPRRWGAATFFLRPLPDFKPGVASFLVLGWRPLRISCEVVGMRASMLAVAGCPAPRPRTRLTAPRGAGGAGHPRLSAGGRALERLLGRDDLEPLVAGDGLVGDAPGRDVEPLHEARVRAQRPVQALAR